MKENFLFLKKVTDKTFWETVRTSPKYHFIVEELLEAYKRYEGKSLEELPYRLFKQFFDNGNRTNFERYYFDRRERMNVCALLSMIFPEEEAYLEELQDVLWAVCNEYSWALPAHLGLSKKTGAYDEENIKNEFNLIDLFASETGYALSEIKAILGERLDDDVKKRISTEVERRIISPFMNDTYFWEFYPDNWAAVCAGSVGCAFLYERPDLFPKVKERIDASLRVFLSSYKAGGVCEEGVTYWEYGFGFFVAYAQTLYEHTGGKEDLFAGEHVKSIAEYANIVFLNDGYPLTFSDASMLKNPVSFGLLEQLKAYYGDVILTLNKENYSVISSRARWQNHIRSIAYFNPDREYKAEKREDVILKQDAGLFIKRSKLYDIAVTAGNNDAPHNHNDLGSFILRVGEDRVFDDLGAGEYTKAYFEAESRYQHLVCGSQGHSVPIINGYCQPAGKEYRGEMTYAENKLTVDLSKAYNCPGLNSFIRSFDFKEKSFTLQDSFSFCGEGDVTERFITKIKPEITAEGIEVANAKLTYNKNDWEPSVLEDGYRDHYNCNCGEVTVYILDFKPRKEDVTHFEMTITV
ncbi:MAG: heparinase II/III family protein [Clostridia bacterium]|nr:heparinase II/III family protein [Clostridia bacterium]